MCGGAKRAHHARVERERYEGLQAGIAAQAERNRQVQLEAMTAMQQEANKRQEEALRLIAESSKQPIKVKTAEDATTPLMRTRQKSSTSNIGSLRINRTPGTNVGMGISGTNIG